jgi:hypothetical protein
MVVVAVVTMAVAAVDNSMPVLLEGLQAADLRQPIPGGTGVADRRITRHPLTPGAIGVGAHKDTGYSWKIEQKVAENTRDTE